MNYGLEEILWLLVLFDSIISNIIIWFFPKWYNKKFKGKVAYTIVNGSIVYDGFDIVENKAGKFINSNKKSL